MHILINHIAKNIGIILFLIILIFIHSVTPVQSDEQIIKERKALFSKNYKTAKKVQSLSSNGDFEESKELMIEMSKNYETLLGLFPENSKKGFKTGSLPTIWEDKENFNALMTKSSTDMIKLASVIEETEDVGSIIGKLMWSNCKSCHSKYRKPH